MLKNILIYSMNFRQELNEQQYQAVSTKAQYVRVVAGAGSGKTRTLTYRIAYLISELGVDPSRILAITFTNKAAREMQIRAEELVSEVKGYVPGLNISTFHSFCARFLRIEHKAIDYPRMYTIFDEEDQNRLIKSVVVESGYKKSDPITKDLAKYIARNKTKGLYPEDIKISFEKVQNESQLLKMYALYELRKTEQFALDFDDLLLKTIVILKENEQIRDHWCNRFDYIMVDEFQDTNDVQYHLMKLLLREDSNVYVVGDPDQTIYTWRGANQKIMLNFDAYFGEPETIILNENYRSTSTILNAANKLIAHNKNRLKKDLFTNSGAGERIETIQQPRQENEAQWVAKEIKAIANRQTDENGDPLYSNIAILYRSSYVTKPFESALTERNIPYRIFGGVRFYERAEVKDLLAYFNLMYNNKDNIAFERIVNTPRRSVGEAAVDVIRSESIASSLSEYEYMRDFDNYASQSCLSTKARNGVLKMVELMEKTKGRLESGENYGLVLNDFVTSLGYYDYLKDDEAPDEDRIGNVKALLDDIANFISHNPGAAFQEYLQNVTLLTSADDINGDNFVSLMTVHVAKGLEFDYVFVISFVDGVFPNARCLAEGTSDGAEEERRLAYVAFTRAKKKLFVSCNSGYTYQSDSHNIPSPFFSEAGLSLPKGGGYYGTTYNKKTKDSWSPSFAKRSSSFFDDGDNYDPFIDDKPRTISAVSSVEPENNGIFDWKIGDKAHHETFGDGVVIAVIDKNTIQVEFVEQGKKVLLAQHKKLSKIASKGGEA